MRDGAIADAIWLYSALIAARAHHKSERAREGAIHMRWAKFVALPARAHHKLELAREGAIHMRWDAFASRILGERLYDG